MAGKTKTHCIRGHEYAVVGRVGRSRCGGCVDIRREQHRAASRKAERKRRGVKNPTDEKRSGPCEICGRVLDTLHLDHDKETGNTRGWLCMSCNTGLGKFNDSADRLLLAAHYLRRVRI